MNSQEIYIVQSTFAQVRPVSVIAAEFFYHRLFTLDPALRPMFKGDMAHQGRMLMSMLHTAVTGLTNLDALVPVVRKLGARHVDYGVRAEHYETVGSALLWALDQCLGDQFTPPVRQAWSKAYELLTDVMQFGASEALVPHAVAA